MKSFCKRAVDGLSVIGGELHNNFPTEAILATVKDGDTYRVFIGCRKQFQNTETKLWVDSADDKEISFEFIEKLYKTLKKNREQKSTYEKVA